MMPDGTEDGFGGVYFTFNATWPHRDGENTGISAGRKFVASNGSSLEEQFHQRIRDGCGGSFLERR